MALQLIVDNTEYHNWLARLISAINRSPLLKIPADHRDLLLSVEPDEIEGHLRRALALGL
jgi:hypothetical protein